MQHGQNINLTRRSEEGSPPPTYEWEGGEVRNLPPGPGPGTTDSKQRETLPDKWLHLIVACLAKAGSFLSTRDVHEAKRL